MLGLIVLMAGLCAVSAALGVGDFLHLAGAIQSMFLALTAFSGFFLVAACDAFETNTATVIADEEE